MDLLSFDNLVFLLPLVAAILLVLLMAAGAAGDHDVHADHDLHADHHAGALRSVAEFFGAGRVPFAIIAVSSLMLWGIAGLGTGLAAKWTLFSRVAVAGAVSLLGTRFTATTIGRLVPSLESYATRDEDLVGRSAQVLHEIGPEGGVVRLVDDNTSLRDLHCHAPREQTPIPLGTPVIVTGYDEASRTFTVSMQSPRTV